MHPAFESLSRSQRARLIHLEMTLQFVGVFSRQTFSDELGRSGSQATVDIGSYRKLAPENLTYDAKTKQYFITESFTPLFEVSPQRALAWLTHREGQGDGFPSAIGLPYSAPLELSCPSTPIIAAVSRAIHGQRPLSITYESLRGRSERIIVPHSLVYNGHRWHVRAYDRKTFEFRDFVLTRITKAVVETTWVSREAEKLPYDLAWTHWVELELVPHPNSERPEVTRLDYGMKESELKIKLRLAEAGYSLRQWCVDCTPDHSLCGPEYRLWLRNHAVLSAIPNALLAPGYVGLSGEVQSLGVD